MIIDFLFAMLLVFAAFKGFSRGFIVAVFSAVAFMVGLAAALKLSSAVAVSLHNKMGVTGYWLPVLSFLAVFIVVALAVKWGAAILKRVVSFVLLGWLDALAGFVLYALLYSMIFSIVLFYAARMHLISPETQLQSKTFGIIEPFAPAVMRFIGKVIPFFSHIFSDLGRFFQSAAPNT